MPRWRKLPLGQPCFLTNLARACLALVRRLHAFLEVTEATERRKPLGQE